MISQRSAYLFEKATAGEPVKFITSCVGKQFGVTNKVLQYQLCRLLGPQWMAVLQVTDLGEVNDTTTKNKHTRHYHFARVFDPEADGKVLDEIVRHILVNEFHTPLIALNTIVQ